MQSRGSQLTQRQTKLEAIYWVVGSVLAVLLAPIIITVMFDRLDKQRPKYQWSKPWIVIDPERVE